MAHNLILFLTICSSIHPTFGLFDTIGWNQAVFVTGRLICDGQPDSGVLVKLYQDGTIYDNLLGETHSQNDGTFSVSGKFTNIFTIDPKINIYHSCNYDGLCSKKLTINVPHSAVVTGSSSNNNFDIGTINLADQFSGETTDCIH